jgi:sterol desaturase/sphingolipid hydroxylase (fatty acid hydroxylase superfamily)
MANWLLAHQAQVQSYLWLGSFVAVALWESFRPRRPLATGAAARWFNNIALQGAAFLLVWLCVPVAAFSFAVLAQERGWGLFNYLSLPAWLSCMLAVLMLDLGTYAVHRLFHTRLLWRYHKVHHCDLDVDCGTAIRHHPIESVLVLGTELIIIASVGAPPLAVLIAVTLAAVAAVFNHGNVAIAARIDRLMRRFIVTPDMHRIHHSVMVHENNSNFSNLLPWWDHLFSTYRHEPQLGHESMVLGLEEARTMKDVTLWRLLAMPFLSPKTTAASSTPGPQPQS